MTDVPSAHVHLVSSLRTIEGKGSVRIEDRFDADVDDVWTALTNPVRLARWLGQFDGALRPGGDFRARFFASEWVGSGRVTICEPGRRLRVEMTQDDATDTDSTAVTLGADGNGTRIVVEQQGLPTDQLAAYGAGLQVHVEDLGAHLRGGERCDARARWSALFPTYEAKALHAD